MSTRVRRRTKKTASRHRHTRKGKGKGKGKGGALSNQANVSEVVQHHIPTTIDKNDPRPGLHLPHHVVSRISGPVSMAFLRPTPEAMDSYRPHGISLPLILLFGDQHESVEGMCSNCTCLKEEKECCFEIYDKPFLQELDAIGRAYPIDYYTEFFDLIDERSILSPPQNDMFYRFFHKTAKECHKRELRKNHRYTLSCPTRFIRWHYGDSRQMYHYAESAMIIQHFLVENSILGILTTTPHTAHTSINNVRRAVIPYIASNMRRYIKSDEQIHSLLEFHKQIVWHALSVLFSKVSDPTDLSAHIRMVIQTFSEQLASLLFQAQHASGIYKQLQKINLPAFREPSRLATILFETYMKTPDLLAHLEQCLQTTHPTNLEWAGPTIMNIFLSYEELPAPIIDTLVHPQNIQFFIEILTKTMGVIVPLSAPLLDLYTLFRMIKNPTDNVPAVLSIVYVGSRHMRNMINILTHSPFGYQMEYHTHTYPSNYLHNVEAKDPISRCISIDAKLPLVEYVNEHAQQFARNDKNYVKPYHRVIQTEWEARKRAPPPLLPFSLLPPNVAPSASAPSPAPAPSLAPPHEPERPYTPPLSFLSPSVGPPPLSLTPTNVAM
jgi:hypothetical protein